MLVHNSCIFFLNYMLRGFFRKKSEATTMLPQSRRGAAMSLNAICGTLWRPVALHEEAPIFGHTLP